MMAGEFDVGARKRDAQMHALLMNEAVLHVRSDRCEPEWHTHIEAWSCLHDNEPQTSW